MQFNGGRFALLQDNAKKTWIGTVRKGERNKIYFASRYSAHPFDRG